LPAATAAAAAAAGHLPGWLDAAGRLGLPDAAAAASAPAAPAARRRTRLSALPTESMSAPVLPAGAFMRVHRRQS